MLFAYDTEAMLAFTTALINTEPGASNSGEDELTSVAELEALLDEHEYSGRRDRDAAELEEIRGLRTEFRRYWNVDRDEAAERPGQALGAQQDRGLQRIPLDIGQHHFHAGLSKRPARAPHAAPLRNSLRRKQNRLQVRSGAAPLPSETHKCRVT